MLRNIASSSFCLVRFVPETVLFFFLKLAFSPDLPRGYSTKESNDGGRAANDFATITTFLTLCVDLPRGFILTGKLESHGVKRSSHFVMAGRQVSRSVEAIHWHVVLAWFP